MPISQLNKLKLEIKNGIKVILNLSPNIIGNSNDETNFQHKLLLLNRLVPRLCKIFVNYSSAKTQLSKIVQSGRFLSKLLGPLLKTGLPLMKNVLKPLPKNLFIPLGLAAAAF